MNSIPMKPETFTLFWRFCKQMKESGKITCLLHFGSYFSNLIFFRFSSVQFSRSVIPDSLRPHESQHTRPPCPSPTPGVHPNSCPSRWCHPAISSSVIPFSSCPQYLPASGSFPMSQLLTWVKCLGNHYSHFYYYN